MIKLNDTNIFVGEIKQILKSFNLPNILIGDYHYLENHHYLYNGHINISDGNTVTEEDVYKYGNKYDGITTNLRIDNAIYDRYTHRYLGKYLRFIKSYMDLNLMSMYNLFDSEAYEKSIKISDSITMTYGNGYAMYSVPAHFGEVYTIKTDSKLPIECCVVLDNYKNDVFTPSDYYKKISSNESLYTKLETINKDFVAWDDNVRLIIRVPESTSSITILEGDYITTSSTIDGSSSYEASTFKTKPILLTYINDSNYLLSDKLIEYITENVICQLSEQYDVAKLDALMMDNELIDSKHAGVWTDSDEEALKKFIVNNIYGDNESHRCSHYDLLGACDSTVEEKMTMYDGGII